MPQSKLDEAIARFDALNAQDPNMELSDGIPLPKEMLYAQRMTKMLSRYVPDASEELQLAVRCQHIQRWKIPRSDYPMTKPGYHQWRNALKTFHAGVARNVLQETGYAEDKINRVCALVAKTLPSSDAEAQILEDVIVLVFLEHYLEQFIHTHSDYDASKFEEILNKSLMKISEKARLSIFTMLSLPENLQATVNRLMAR